MVVAAGHADQRLVVQPVIEPGEQARRAVIDLIAIAACAELARPATADQEAAELAVASRGRGRIGVARAAAAHVA